jgi:hypothetical protein
MFFDTILTRQQKIYISMITGIFWIYFRTFDCYALLERKKIFPIILVVLWIYLYEKDPLFLPIGLGIMILYKSIN